MKLQQLLAGTDIGAIAGSASIEIASIECDSRKVTPGGIFFALHGAKLEGAQFVADALRGERSRKTGQFSRRGGLDSIDARN
jgi:UDP-N-acetylmuramoyl-L-alanyl-D-glutamate--2,6-diaminopimelate ligase